MASCSISRACALISTDPPRSWAPTLSTPAQLASGASLHATGTLAGEHPRSSLSLGLVHGRVCLCQQFPYIVLARVAVRTYADAQYQLFAKRSPHGTLLEAPADAPEHRFRRGENRSVPQRQDELIPSPAGQPVALPDTTPYHPGHVAEADIACLVAVGVVYGLEVVDVHHRNREERPSAFGPCEVLGQVLLTLPAVGQPGKVVCAREPFEQADRAIQMIDSVLNVGHELARLVGEACGQLGLSTIV